MLDAAAGRDGSISYGGKNQLQYADDVAAAFIAASRCGHRGAAVLNLPGTTISMCELARLIGRQSPGGVSVTAGEKPLPFPASVDTTAFDEIVGPVQRTPIEAGIRETIERFADLERLRCRPGRRLTRISRAQRKTPCTRPDPIQRCATTNTMTTGAAVTSSKNAIELGGEVVCRLRMAGTFPNVSRSNSCWAMPSDSG